MPTLANKQDCCGCAACFNTCAFNAIVMEADETGFLYPVVNIDNCKSCNLCEKACPALSPLQYAKIIEEENQPHAYVAQHTNEEIRRQSTSGGAFTAIAEAIIMLGGVVFGASMDGGFVVRHTYIETIADLEKFRNSKYVQSEIGNSFRQCKAFLENGRWVCFSGTPCQISGLEKYLGNEYRTLITVDIVCLSVPSPRVFSKYLELRRKEVGQVTSILFRSKKRGYSYPTVEIRGAILGKEKSYLCGSESDEYLRLFLKGFSIRDCCRNCNFQMNRVSDFTIWDCNNIALVDSKMDDDKGTSNIIVWTEAGQELMGKFNDSLKYRKTDIQISINQVSIRKEWKTERPANFYTDLDTLTSEEFFSIYASQDMRTRVSRVIRDILYFTGLHRWMKQVIQSRRKV